MVRQRDGYVKCEHRSVRRAAVVVSLLVLASACGPAAHLTHQSHKVGSQKLIEQVNDTAVPSAAAATSKPVAHFGGPLLVVQLTDRTGRHPAQIPVRVTGPVDAVQYSDAHGNLTFFTPGRYTFAVVQGCAPAVQVFTGGQASGAAAAGQSQHGTLDVDWRHRFSPSPPVFSNPSPPWPVGQDVSVQFNVIDRCTNRFVPNASYPTFTFVTSPNLRVSKKPTLKSNAKSQGFVTVSCLKPGPVTLGTYDTANPKDSFNMARESSDYSPPRCGS